MKVFNAITALIAQVPSIDFDGVAGYEIDCRCGDNNEIEIHFTTSNDRPAGHIELSRAFGVEGSGESWDTAIHTNNADCASLRDQVKLASLMVEWFEAHVPALFEREGFGEIISG